jgi:hypothetical protein
LFEYASPCAAAAAAVPYGPARTRIWPDGWRGLVGLLGKTALAVPLASAATATRPDGMVRLNRTDPCFAALRLSPAEVGRRPPRLMVFDGQFERIA